MPTLRKFFKHFAPKLMGSSSNPSSYGAAYHNSYANQPTSATKNRHRSHYEQFSEENELHMFHLDRSRKNTEEAGFTSVAFATGGRQSADDMSDKAILQTKTVTIEHE